MKRLFCMNCGEDTLHDYVIVERLDSMHAKANVFCLQCRNYAAQPWQEEVHRDSEADVH